MIGTESAAESASTSLKRCVETVANGALEGGGATHGTKSKSKRSKRNNHAKVGSKTCCRCKKNVAKKSFSNTQWKLPSARAKCRECIDSATANRDATSLTLNQIKQQVTRNAAKVRQEAKEMDAGASIPKVVTPPGGKGTRNDHRCKESLPGQSCSTKQRKFSAGMGKECIDRTHSHEREKGQDRRNQKGQQQGEIPGNNIAPQIRRCHQCTNVFGMSFFSKRQWTSENPTCKQCISHELRQPNDQKKKGRGKGKIEEKIAKESRVITDPTIIKAKLSERVTILPPTQQQRKSFSFTWECTPISRTDEKNVLQHVIVPGYYHRLTPQEIQQLSLSLGTFPTEMTVYQAISLRSSHLMQKALMRHHHLQRRKRQLRDWYAAGYSVLEISRTVDGPPVNVFRTILAEMDYSKTRIRKCLSNPEREFAEREIIEYRAAEGADVVSNFDHDASHRRAEEFERVVARFLAARGVAFVTQKQLAAEQEREFGTPVLTPDFLILDELAVNGQAVKWLDAKAFYGANTPMNIKRTRKQMSRYVAHWGSGAIMYLHGFSEMLVMEGCVMLSAQAVISVDDLAALQERTQLANQA